MNFLSIVMNQVPAKGIQAYSKVLRRNVCKKQLDEGAVCRRLGRMLEALGILLRCQGSGAKGTPPFIHLHNMFYVCIAVFDKQFSIK